MAIRDLSIFPDPVLRQETSEVEIFDEQLHQLLDDMAQSMYFNKGLGLAAPQVGISLRVTVIDVDQKEGSPKLIELVNPRIEELSQDQEEQEEGCLSFPGESEVVIRPSVVTVSAMDRTGKEFQITADGLFGRALQHEIDHLNGVLFIDHISRLRRSLIQRRMKKLAAKRTKSA